MPKPPRKPAPLLLRGARLWSAEGATESDLAVSHGRVAAARAPDCAELDLQGRVLLPGLVNAHDHLDLSLFPPLGQPPYTSAYDWAAAAEASGPELAAALAPGLRERLLLGGLRNLLCGVCAVAHHGADHRVLGDVGFPVRVQRRYHFALSPGQTPALRKTYRTSDRRIPWFVHAGEGTDARARAELEALVEANVLRQNTVIVRGLAFGAEQARRMASAQACLVWCPEADRWQYGAVADIGAMQAAGVPVGLGSESPAAGARDLLSSLASARSEASLDEGALIDMATRAAGQVARLPVGGFAPGDPADFVAVDGVERFLAGERASIVLVLVAGRALFGEPGLMLSAGRPTVPLRVDGAERALVAELSGPLRVGLSVASGGRAAAWLRGITLG